MTSGIPEAFGFVPAHVVADLQDIGNWKSRATAIDLLYKALKDVSRPQNLVESLPDFVKFLVGLIADPNFKIAISSMSILGELASKVGSELEAHLSVVVPALLEKFTDSKILVRAANMKAIKKLMGATSPGGVLELLALGSSHTSWRVREEVLNTHIMAMLSFGRSAYQPAAVYSLMRAGMGDGKDKVRLVALEGMAVLGARAGKAELTALMAGQKPGARPLAEEHKREVMVRLANPALPAINGDGLVEHCVELPAAAGAEAADMRLADAAFGGAGGTKLPWGDPSTPPRPRLRTATSSDHPGSSSANGRERPAGPGGGGGGAAEGGPPAGRRQASALHLDSVRSGPPAMLHHGVEPGGDGGLWSPSYRPAPMPSGAAFGHPPSRLGSHDSFTAGAAYGGGGAGGGGGGGGGYPISAASGWSLSAARPPPLHMIERPASPLREAASNGHLPAASHPLLSLASDSSQERSSAGSAPPHARDLHGGAHTPSALQPLKHHWGAARSTEGHPAGLKLPLEGLEDSPLSPAARNFQPLVSSRGSAPGVAPSEMAAAAAAAAGNHHHHMRGDGLEYIPRPSSVRTQAAAELRESRDPRAPPSHSLSHPPLGAGSSAATAPGGGGGGGVQHSSSAMALWLHQGGIDDHTASRQETFSPSKAEMLARLKVRQIEKRAVTAQMDPPPGSSHPHHHGDLLLASANDIAPIAAAASHGSITGGVPPGRRHLFTQLSDNQRDRGGAAGGADRGYNSVLNTPTRAGGASPSPFDETPASARPPRTGLAARLGRATPMAVDPGSGAATSRSPPLASPGVYATASPAASEDSPARPLAPASPALNRLRARSAEVPNLYPPNTPGGGPGPGAAPATPGGSSGPFWEKGRTGGDVAPEELAPLQEPDKHIRVVIAKLIEANHADRKELDWQGQYEALVDARRLVRHHGEVVRACLHEFVRAATPAIDQLRSQTCKCALALFSECFTLLGRAMDRELDEVVPALLKKAGEVSNAGRDNFLAEAADRTLLEMGRCCGEARCAAALLAVAGHKNPYVRGKVAFHLDCHMEACAGGARQSLASNPALVERVFKAGAAFLDEGGLDTRTYGKRIVWHVKAMLASRAEFDRLVHSVTPESLHRKVVDTVEGLNGPPPPPSRAVAGGVPGSRLASRQLGPGGTPASPMRPILDGAMGGGMMGGPGAGAGGGGGGGGGMGGSLTQNPPPMRQSSYSAPSPLGAAAGGATPERRRGLGRQRTSDLDGIPEGPGSSNTSGNGRLPPRSAAAAGGGGGGGGGGAGGSLSARGSSGSGGGGANGDGGGGGFGPAVQETVVKSLLMLTAKDFRERIEALRAVEGVVGSLPGAPDSLLIQLLDALVARLGDANAKVSMAALELVGQLAGALRSRISLSLNTLVPALAAGLGAGNDKIRGAALAATDALLSTVDPAMLVQHFSHVVGNGTIQRGKPLLVDKLVAIAGALYGSKPQLVARYAVPAAFALLNDSKGGEAKAAANALLGALARLMGPALLDQAGGLNAVAQQRVADAVAAASGQAPAGGAELRRGGSFGRDREAGGGADRPWAPRR